MAHKTLINGTAYEISGGRTLVNGTGYAIGKGKTLVSGTAYEVGFGTAIGSLPLGTTVPLKINGSSRDFIIVHQGLPSSAYDSSCNGTWLLMKDCYEQVIIDNDSSAYGSSDIHNYLNNTFFNLFDTEVRGAIKQVKVPYCTTPNREGENVANGSNGLTTKVFFLSLTEVGLYKRYSDASHSPIEGSVLGYFNGVSDSTRIATFNGSAVYWWTRTPVLTDLIGAVNKKGAFANALYNYTSVSMYSRPAIILPSEFEV